MGHQHEAADRERRLLLLWDHVRPAVQANMCVCVCVCVTGKMWIGETSQEGEGADSALSVIVPVQSVAHHHWHSPCVPQCLGVHECSPVPACVCACPVVEAAAQVAPDARPKWSVLGREVCKSAFLSLLGVSKKIVNRLAVAAKSGRHTPPDDARRNNGKKQSRWLDVDAFLFYMWEYVAEPLAESGVVDPGPESAVTVEDDAESSDGDDSDGECESEPSVLQSVVGRLAIATDEHSGSVKWLGHCTRAELYDQYCAWHLVHKMGSQPAGRTTFRKVLAVV